MSGQSGFHAFGDGGAAWGSYEVFWSDGGIMEDGPGEGMEFDKPGWYWWACFPGCLPDGEPDGPYGTSTRARCEADEGWPA